MPSMEERIAMALAKKEEGNAHLKAGEFKKASFHYKHVQLYIGPYVTNQDGSKRSGAGGGGGSEADSMMKMVGKRGSEEAATPDQQAQMNEVMKATLSNLALAQLKLQRWMEAIRFADEALAMDSSMVKAVYRRGVARLNIGDTDRAREDFLICLSKDPNDTAPQQMLAEVDKLDAAAKEKQKKAMSKMFS